MNWVAGSVPAYLQRWGVRPDGEATSTASSWLVPGVWHDRRVMLKVARVEEEARAGLVLGWWAGSAAVAVHEVDDHAVLMDLATGGRDLVRMSQDGLDDDATVILCQTVAALHAMSGTKTPPDAVVPLTRWFRGLIEPATRAPRDPGIERAAAVARELLEAPGDDGAGCGAAGIDHGVVLHGDIHHANVLDFDGRWLVIDPKGLIGDRAFDYANIFCNPDTETAVANFPRRLAIVSEQSGIDRQTMRAWITVWCALSTSWTAETWTAETWTAERGGTPWTAQVILAEFG
ncbi:aminoglycoside phosphotransferase family protein [Lacisediminihabitans sp.]|jgi:streptomycin 6-kinase|uniref:aminoglycoside phosphotransferase family protein n=1 Tax=Lacisediminihabitans sp. TaxID=2787631 RepID=UPI002F92B849